MLFRQALSHLWGSHQVWFVEVTGGWNTGKIVDKANKFKAEVVPRLRRQLADFAIIPDASHWEFGFWAFARKEVTRKLRDKIARHVDLLKVEDLESIAFSWTYWDKRRAGESTSKIKSQSVFAGRVPYKDSGFINLALPPKRRK